MIALVTCRAFPAIGDDDALLAAALARRGVATRAVPWDEAGELAGCEAVVIRATWDYHHRVGEFRDWLRVLERGGAHVENPLPVLRWNLDKRYLRELPIATVPTRWLARGDAPPLRAVLEEQGWDEAVVKPAISAQAHDTFRTARARATADEPAFRRLLDAGVVMVQPFVREILDGEWSLVFIAGDFSHAVRKQPARGDFRVQSMYGGRVVPAAPPPAIVADAARALTALPAPALYARVDGVDVGGRLVVLELEALEPQLFLATHPPAAERLAAALLARLG